MLTGSEMARVDRNAAALGVSPTQLMESAGNAVARAVRAETTDGDRIVVVAGRGHNGGDALVAARFLGSPWPGPDAAPRGARAGSDYDVTVLLLGRPESLGSLPRDNWDALREGAVDARTVTDASAFELPAAAVVVDGVLGTGVSGELREPAATAARAINGADAAVVSVDVPSGLDAETGALADLHVEPDRVVTFHDRKPGLSDLDADVEVADIGIPAAAETFVGPGDLLALSRDPESHKGQHGEVLVVGGGPYTGAPALAARAALRAGADLVRVACPESVAREVQGYAESLIVRPFDGARFGPDDVEPVLDLAAAHDAVVFGPGLGDAAETRDAAVAFLSGYDGTIVVDADALAAVPEADVDATVIGTPHRGELGEMGAAVAGDDDRWADWRTRADGVASAAADLGVTLLVKGPYDVISDGETTRVNRTGNPGMTVGGTGDVLAGATGALAATLSPVDAAAVGAFANGRAGDAAVEAGGGYGLLPTDLLDRLPAALWGEHDA